MIATTAHITWKIFVFLFLFFFFAVSSEWRKMVRDRQWNLIDCHSDSFHIFFHPSSLLTGVIEYGQCKQGITEQYPALREIKVWNGEWSEWKELSGLYCIYGKMTIGSGKAYSTNKQNGNFLPGNKFANSMYLFTMLDNHLNGKSLLHLVTGVTFAKLTTSSVCAIYACRSIAGRLTTIQLRHTVRSTLWAVWPADGRHSIELYIYIWRTWVQPLWRMVQTMPCAQ